MRELKLNKRQKYIKEKYFKLVEGYYDPFYYNPIIDKTLNLAPITLIKIIDLIIDILEKEYDGEINWAKII